MSNCESSKIETNKKGEKCYEQVKKCKCIVKERLLGSSNKPKPQPPPSNVQGSTDPCSSLDFNDPIFCGGSRQPALQGPSQSPYGMIPNQGPTPPGPLMGPRMNQQGSYYSEIPQRAQNPPYGNYNQNPSNVYYDNTYYGSSGGYQR